MNNKLTPPVATGPVNNPWVELINDRIVPNRFGIPPGMRAERLEFSPLTEVLGPIEHLNLAGYDVPGDALGVALVFASHVNPLVQEALIVPMRFYKHEANVIANCSAAVFDMGSLRRVVGLALVDMRNLNKITLCPDDFMASDVFLEPGGFHIEFDTGV